MHVNMDGGMMHVLGPLSDHLPLQRPIIMTIKVGSLASRGHLPTTQKPDWQASDS